MKISRLTIYLLSFIGICFSSPDEQYTIARVELMPALPQPLHIRDWKTVALNYDNFVFDFNRQGTYLPLIKWDSVYTIDAQPTFSLPSYVGGSNNSGEAINTMAAVVSASLVGLDKSDQNGSNWVRMCRKYFAPNSCGIYLNNAPDGWGASFWYDLLPNILFYQLYDMYPAENNFNLEFISVAQQWYQASVVMGGSSTGLPNVNYTYFNFQSMSPVYNGYWREPDAAAGIAWLEYNAWLKTGGSDFLQAAEWGMEYLQARNNNPLYEIMLPFGAYAAARMNAEMNYDYDVGKLVNWCFGPSSARPGWGIVTGNWNGYDCGGLAGSITDSEGYAFTMGTYESAGALAPLVRYDNHFARGIGKWLLNLVNASRYYYANGLPVENQDGEAWALTYDSTFCISFEGLRNQGQGGISPLATGDAVGGGWAPTNFALYGASHVGILGALVDTTNVSAILRIDLLATDYFHNQAYPSYLYYNPYNTQQSVLVAAGTDSMDLYDAVANSFIAHNIVGDYLLPIPGDSAVVLVLVPSSSTITYRGYALLADNIIVDYHYTDIPDTTNRPPVITGISAEPEQVLMEGQSVISCSAYDPDEDALQYTWHASGGNISGTDSSALWIAPDTVGSFFITCTVHDAAGNRTHAGVNVTVIDTTEHQYPELVAYYPFNGNANDESGQTNNGSVYGAQLVPDRHGNQAAAYRFDGQDDRIQIPNSAQLNFQEAITVTCWLKPGEIPASGETYPLSHGSWEERWKFSHMTDRRLRWTINAQNGIGDLDSDTQLDTSHYYFVAGVYDGTHMKLLVNGQSESTRTLTGGIKQTSLDITIGQSKPRVTAYNFNGIIDDIHLYSIALSDSAIAALYQQELIVDHGDPALPSSFALRSNYPNPFNPVTTIEFELPIHTHVTLTIINILGQNVAVLVDDYRSPGLHRVNWNARS
ncbi:MAG: hypothetical protein H8E14_06590, partial [Candidatus Marinimicrobia bacterium]|nr:hypothetical protein [Candidatus Neomarinimicrobiota bacterium]